MDVLRHVNFGLDSDVVVAFDTSVNITSNQVIKKLYDLNESYWFVGPRTRSTV